MDIWKNLSQKGDKLFNRLAYSQAKEQYIRALDRSQFLYYRWQDTKEAIDCVVSSHIKLCDCLIMNCDYEIAGQIIVHAHKVLSAMVENHHHSDEVYYHLLEVRSNIAKIIHTLILDYPEINLCEDCYSRIFDCSINYQRSNRLN